MCRNIFFVSTKTSIKFNDVTVATIVIIIWKVEKNGIKLALYLTDRHECAIMRVTVARQKKNDDEIKLICRLAKRIDKY